MYGYRSPISLPSTFCQSILTLKTLRVIHRRLSHYNSMVSEEYIEKTLELLPYCIIALWLVA